MKFDTEKAARQHRFEEMAKLHEIEGNPLTAEDRAMFEMFEREGWTGEQRRSHIIALAKAKEEALSIPAAE